MAISELKLAKELIRKPSITPKDAGAINLLAKNLRSLGFKCQIINFKNIKNCQYKKNIKETMNMLYFYSLRYCQEKHNKKQSPNYLEKAI